MIDQTRIDEIEMTLSHQEKLISELNKTIYEQQQQINKLEKTIQECLRTIQGMSEATEIRNLRHEKPPHY